MVSSPHHPTARASPLQQCDERPEDWCRDVATAAKCGTLELCRITVWDQALGVTALGDGGCGGAGGDGGTCPSCPKTMGCGEKPHLATPVLGTQRSIC